MKPKIVVWTNIDYVENFGIFQRDSGRRGLIPLLSFTLSVGILHLSTIDNLFIVLYNIDTTKGENTVLKNEYISKL